MKTDIKLIALDLDNTLLNSQKTISDANRSALKRCSDAGIEIVPCTGRIWKGIPDIVKDLPGVHYAITINGGKVVDLVRQETIVDKSMPYETAAGLFEFIKDYDVMYDCYIDSQGYVEERFLSNLDRYNVPKNIHGMIHSTRKVVPDLIEFVRENKRPVEKITFNFADLSVRGYIKEKLSGCDDIAVSASFVTNLEINTKSATKGDGIVSLSEYIGIDPAETMGFGDGENDVSMMKLAGIGVAMDNAVDEVKEAADYVTLSNDDDGVAAALDYFLFDGTA